MAGGGVGEMWDKQEGVRKTGGWRRGRSKRSGLCAWGGAQDKEEVAHMVAAGGGGLTVPAVAARGRLRTGMWDGDADSEGTQRLVQLLSHFYTVDEGCGSCDNHVYVWVQRIVTAFLM